MSVLTKVRCSVGRHTGEWSHPDGRCTIVRTCDSCGEVEAQTQHVWGPFAYTAQDRCEEIHRCERCGATELRVWHEWGPWRYSNLEFNSPQERACRRCHQVERTRYTLR